MKSPALWKVVGVVVLAIALLNIVLGINLLPSLGEAREKNTFVPLLITWAMIWVSAGSATVLAGFLLTWRRQTA